MTTSEVPASSIRVENDSLWHSLVTALLFLGSAIMWLKVAQVGIAHTCYNLGSFTWLCHLAVPFT